MRVNISLSPPQNAYEFAGVTLSYGISDSTEVALNIDYRNLFEFTRRQDGVAFDLFIISSLVYGIDILLPRREIGLDGCSREIVVSFPVERSDLFITGKELLEKTLNFLTGDIWTISFEERLIKRLYKLGKRQKAHCDGYQKKHKVVNLFSGGIDSLIGAINQLHNSNDEVCLVSHMMLCLKVRRLTKKTF